MVTVIPSCPTGVHHGMMLQAGDDGEEWVCQVCYRRIYTVPAAPLKLGRADGLAIGELRSWVRRLIGEGYSSRQIARIVDRDAERIRVLVRSILQ